MLCSVTDISWTQQLSPITIRLYYIMLYYVHIHIRSPWRRCMYIVHDKLSINYILLFIYLRHSACVINSDWLNWLNPDFSEYRFGGLSGSQCSVPTTQGIIETR